MNTSRGTVLAQWITTIVAFSGVVAILLMRQPPWSVLLIPLGLVGGVLFDESWRIYSHHGVVHGSIVYAILERGVPPENPFLAGEWLGYPYGHHFLLAKFAEIANVAPPWGFAATNLLALIATGLLLDRMAQVMGVSARGRTLVVVLALFGTSPFAFEPLRPLAAAAGDTEVRIIPLLKFATVNSNQVGIVFFVASLYGLCLAISNGGSRIYASLWLGIGWLGCGLLYPTLAPAVIGCTLVAVVAAILLAPDAWRHHRLSLAAGFAIACVLIVPWITALNAGRATEPVLALDLSLAHLVRNAKILFASMVIPVSLLVWQRSHLATFATPALRLWLGLSAAGLSLGYLGLHLSIHSEYKYLLVGQIPLAILLAGTLEGLLERRRTAILLILLLFMLPACFWIGKKISEPWPVRDPAVVESDAVEHLDPAQRELHLWITRETPSDAVMIDTHLSLPVFARRPLFVATDLRRRQERQQGVNDGVGLTARRWLIEVQGHNPEQVARRAKSVVALLAPRSTADAEEVARTMRRELPDRPLYIIVRDARVRKRLAGKPVFDEVFANGSAAVFTLPSDR